MDYDKHRKHRYAGYFHRFFEMVNDPSTDSIVSWSDNGKSFIVWNESEFCKAVLPVFFVSNKMAAFVRQLEILGFNKIESEHWEFAHDQFVRGHPELLPPPESFLYQRPSEAVIGSVMESVKEMASAMRKKQVERTEENLIV
uniref:Heat stress transcription factor A-4b n=1 Tax=Noccaea caerulescens TaxID=107243 RepID=A0A1J3ILY1_NOCCA